MKVKFGNRELSQEQISFILDAVQNEYDHLSVNMPDTNDSEGYKTMMEEVIEIVDEVYEA